MSFQTIDLGTQGTQSGDTIRNAFTKVNSNFVDAQSQIDGKADSGHVHDSRYYTQSQVDAGFRSSSWIPSKTDIQSSLLNGLLIQVNVGGDGGWNEGIIIDNIGADGEAALSWRQSEMGSNYWISGVNQSPNWKLVYGTSFVDSNVKLELATDGSFLKLAGNNLATQSWVSANFNNYSHPASHSISEVSGLQTALDGKAPNHTHPYRSDSWVPAVNQVTHGYTPGNLIVADTGGVLGDSGTQIEAVTSHVASTSNPHGVTAAQAGALAVGLGSWDTNQLVITSTFGYMKLGPANTYWAHFFTDRDNYYFDHGVHVNGSIRVFNSNTFLTSGDIYEVGTKLSLKYLGITAQAADSAAVEGKTYSDITTYADAAAQAVQDNLDSHALNASNPHSVTYSQVGAAAASHTHSYLPLSGGTLTGALDIPQYLRHAGDTDTGLNFTTNRIRGVAGNTTFLDSDWGRQVPSNDDTVLDIVFDEGTGELIVKSTNFWWTSGKIFAKV